MSNEKQTTADYDHRFRYTRRAKFLAKTAGVLLSLAAGYGAVEATAPDFSGEHTVQLDRGDTLSDIANNEVDGGASHTGETVNEIVKQNHEEFPDGKPNIGSEDLGQTIVVPNVVE